MRAEEEKGGLQGGGARRRRQDVCGETLHPMCIAEHISRLMYIRGAHLHTSYLHKRLFHIHSPHAPMYNMLLQRTQRGAANNIIVLILIEICILFADPHTRIFMRCAKQIHNKTSASMGFVRRALFFAPFLLSFRPAQSGCIYFHWPNGM